MASIEHAGIGYKIHSSNCVVRMGSKDEESPHHPCSRSSFAKAAKPTRTPNEWREPVKLSKSATEPAKPKT